MIRKFQTEKQCIECKEVKGREDFYDIVKGTWHGLSSRCRPCACKKAQKDNIERGYDLKKRYGITKEDVERMRYAQEGKCAICLRTRRLVIDHDHSNGKVRELLCNSCNSAIGLMNEDVLRLDAAKRYIQKHSAKII